ncbi:hypothetical protein EJ08DRAFT_653198 [Tothia fuscella]|uniref:Ethyl tert-butyl ether degradation protein EthD n=1 Tax=Tothia fuscella TaxID=1048955 RepID=A0A9P4NHW3_9PEZI|nr:hypothetical protein EJ08DRAFT_653198 [Tothia fuscella]
MTVHCTVLYPNDDDATFDMKYYLATHMPLVQEKFGPFGMSGYSVLKFQNGPDGSKPQYSVQATLHFDKAESVGKASKEAGEPVFGDVPNFSNKSPIFLVADVVDDKS